MKRFVAFSICMQVFFVQNSNCQCITSGPVPTPSVPLNSNNGLVDTFHGPAALTPSPTVAYGGVGEGNVVVIGELPVSGTTSLTGQVPIVGAVSFNGPVPAYGAISIIGSCTCSCGNPFMY